MYDPVKCNEDLQFYVEIPDAIGCISKSSIGTVNLGDTLTPKTPIITDVSVDSMEIQLFLGYLLQEQIIILIYLNGTIKADLTTDTCSWGVKFILLLMRFCIC